MPLFFIACNGLSVHCIDDSVKIKQNAYFFAGVLFSHDRQEGVLNKAEFYASEFSAVI